MEGSTWIGLPGVLSYATAYDRVMKGTLMLGSLETNLFHDLTAVTQEIRLTFPRKRSCRRNSASVMGGFIWPIIDRFSGHVTRSVGRVCVRTITLE